MVRNVEWWSYFFYHNVLESDWELISLFQIGY
jgi:hypothetical protein